MEASEKKGYFFCGTHNKDCSFGVCFGAPHIGKLSYRVGVLGGLKFHVKFL